MAEYQVLARKYRPQTFVDVLGQEAIVTTLKNAIKNNRLAHAYLFCGSRGTGKTTLARVFAKALNCQTPTPEGEPCNLCSACKEITGGNSLDVLEIDGASHRGIDDVRQINDTVGYTSASGKYKIYIIDEVHMLTKEAFNALLKTLEEPPPKVKFLFATTEPHKVLPTILSRCQRFNLNRIPLEKIIQKLKMICQNQSVTIEEEALRLLAQRADGGLRDAESLLDQIIAFNDGSITAASVADVLGIMPRTIFFALDRAGKEGDLGKAFEVSHRIFSEGKDIHHFIEELMEHFRMLAMIHIAGIHAPFISLSIEDKINYETSAKLYTQEQCLSILDFLTEKQSEIKYMTSAKIALETILLRILRIHRRLPIEFLVRRLTELEKTIAGSSTTFSAQESSVKPQNSGESPAISERIAEKPKASRAPIEPAKPQVSLTEQPRAFAPVIEQVKISVPLSVPPPSLSKESPWTITEDPTPSPADLGIKASKPAPPPAPPVIPVKIELPPQTTEEKTEALKKQSRYDTLLQFAAVELEGTIQRKPMIGYK